MIRAYLYPARPTVGEGIHEPVIIEIEVALPELIVPDPEMGLDAVYSLRRHFYPAPTNDAEEAASYYFERFA